MEEEINNVIEETARLIEEDYKKNRNSEGCN